MPSLISTIRLHLLLCAAAASFLAVEDEVKLQKAHLRLTPERFAFKTTPQQHTLLPPLLPPLLLAH
jgi:hypothetical protein